MFQTFINMFLDFEQDNVFLKYICFMINHVGMLFSFLSDVL
jgi:hypothetical protein